MITFTPWDNRRAKQVFLCNLIGRASYNEPLLASTLFLFMGNKFFSTDYCSFGKEVPLDIDIPGDLLFYGRQKYSELASSFRRYVPLIENIFREEVGDVAIVVYPGFSLGGVMAGTHTYGRTNVVSICPSVWPPHHREQHNKILSTARNRPYILLSQGRGS